MFGWLTGDERAIDSEQLIIILTLCQRTEVTCVCSCDWKLRVISKWTNIWSSAKDTEKWQWEWHELFEAIDNAGSSPQLGSIVEGFVVVFVVHSRIGERRRPLKMTWRTEETKGCRSISYVKLIIKRLVTEILTGWKSLVMRGRCRWWWWLVIWFYFITVEV